MNLSRIIAALRVAGGVLVATLAGIWLGAPLVALLDAQMPFRLTNDLSWLGWLIIAGALALIASAQLSFVRFGGGTGVPGDEPHSLVARGPYRWVRNPLYISGNALLWGNVLAFGSAGLLTLALISAVAFHLFVVCCEEPQLERRFGDAYREYKRAAPRWMPRPPRI